eukprot:TRINITY_DN7605_c0_g2_i1.p1 TRINITY_DN7605_c0_g2~~TRINITY_DN7605_c0_g2_i1.p1  ORF type:complete len:168 (+),score=9.95 TRINITY_DN7605_c0_g2_i1:81-584(+)
MPLDPPPRFSTFSADSELDVIKQLIVRVEAIISCSSAHPRSQSHSHHVGYQDGAKHGEETSESDSESDGVLEGEGPGFSSCNEDCVCRHRRIPLNNSSKLEKPTVSSHQVVFFPHSVHGLFYGTRSQTIVIRTHQTVYYFYRNVDRFPHHSEWFYEAFPIPQRKPKL